MKWLMRRAIAAFERQWHYDAGYLHEIDGDVVKAIYVVRNPDKLRHLVSS